MRAHADGGADRDQPSQVIVPVTVPVSDASGKATGVPVMEQVTGPGAVGLDATWVSEPNGLVNVRSTLAGWKMPRAARQPPGQTRCDLHAWSKGGEHGSASSLTCAGSCWSSNAATFGGS